MKVAFHNWPNPSVLKFASRRDSVEAVVQVTRDAVLGAIDRVWSDTPFDLKLAELRGLAIAPRGDIRDTRTIPAGLNRFVIDMRPFCRSSAART